MYIVSRNVNDVVVLRRDTSNSQLPRAFRIYVREIYFLSPIGFSQEVLFIVSLVDSERRLFACCREVTRDSSSCRIHHSYYIYFSSCLCVILTRFLSDEVTISYLYRIFLWCSIHKFVIQATISRIIGSCFITLQIAVLLYIFSNSWNQFYEFSHFATQQFEKMNCQYKKKLFCFSIRAYNIKDPR